MVNLKLGEGMRNIVINIHVTSTGQRKKYKSPTGFELESTFYRAENV